MSGERAGARPVPTENSAVAGLDGFTHRYAEVNGIRLHYVVGGSGPAMVLLHGWPMSWRDWRSIVPALAKAGFTVIAPDLRGMGDSSKPDGGYDKKTVADDIRLLIQRLGFAQIDLVGTDIGMMVAFAWALHHPHQVRRLVMAESLLPGFGLEELMNPATGGYWHFGFHAQTDLAAMLTQGKEAAYLDPMWKMFSPLRGMADEDRTELLRTYAGEGGMRGGFKHYEALLTDGKQNRAAFKKKLGMPALVLNAEFGIPPRQTLGCVEQAFANVESDIVPSAGHAFASDQPGWTADRLIRFFGHK